MNKKLLVGVFFLVICGGVLLLYTHTNSSSSFTPQGLIPTSTSAPTPTSVYGPGSSRQAVTPNPKDNVVLTASGFVPKVLTIHAGDTVTWMNNSGVQATVNSDPHPLHTAYPPLNLGEFNDGDILILTFPKPGRYSYHNHLDATQTGTILVIE